MTEPWRIAFPVLRDPWSREECLITRRDVIVDARAGVPPTMCEVTGRDRNGRPRRFVVPIAEFERAARAPVHLIQADNIRAPVLVDTSGKPLLHPTP